MLGGGCERALKDDGSTTVWFCEAFAYVRALCVVGASAFVAFSV